MTKLLCFLPALLLATCLGAAGLAFADDAAIPQPVSPLIGEGMYRAAIANVFGADIVINGRFEPQMREAGLLSVGAGSAMISTDGIELYDTLARGIAQQVVAPERRRTLFRCEPQNIKGRDDTCARAFLAATGPLLFRHPLSADELGAYVRIAGETAERKTDFYAGISAVIAEMLISPDFLYLRKTVIPDPEHPGQYRLDSYSSAALLSAYLWAAPPDETLIRAAQNGDLLTSAGLRRQVDRLMLDPQNVEGGVRAFFADMLGFDEYDTLSKDTQFFPEFTPKIVEQSREQTLLTIVDHVVYQKQDYRDLFTTQKTFLTRGLAAIYGVPIADRGDNGQPDHWVPYTYQPGDPRAGILSQISFAALHSPAGRTSPTQRGKALREYLLCQQVPPPPGNVDFKFVTDTKNPALKTTRDRITAHRSEPMCAGCHKLTDPIGLALENFDGAGSFRETENGVKIDTSGQINGVSFVGPAGLAAVVHNDPAATSCVATRSFAFAVGRSPSPQDGAWLKITQQFKASGYSVLALMRAIALSPNTYAVPAPGPNVATAQIAFKE